MNSNIKKIYLQWAKIENGDPLFLSEKKKLISEEEINDCFYTSLSFGTGGLRGRMGFGTNRMNNFIVRRATLGLADTLLKINKNSSVAIAYDTRNNSKIFAIEAALTLASKNLKVHLMKIPTPTPVLSFMVRYLHCDAGIVITASHNPKEYNGYKVCGKDGGQITLKLADTIYLNMQKHNYFEPIRNDIDNLIKNKKIILHEKDINEAFLKSTLKESLFDPQEKKIKILYTPLHGVGLNLVTQLLAKKKYKYSVIKSQAKQDGNFPTCPKPNPELIETMQPGIDAMKKGKFDILFATDPDADRCGVAVNCGEQTRLLSGDEVGILLFDFVFKMKKAKKKLGSKPVVIKTIATSDLIYKIADDYNVKVIDTLTGFKFIGEQLEKLVKKNRDKDFVIGVEDSCGYLSNKDIRDKDSINAALLIAEMANYYKLKKMTLIDRLNEIYEKYGHLTSCLKFIVLEGESGLKKINQLMEIYRSEKFYKSFLDCNGKYDYLIRKGYGSKEKMKSKLPISNVLKFYFKDGSELLARPSGTEPKIKFYYLTPNKEKENEISEILNRYI